MTDTEATTIKGSIGSPASQETTEEATLRLSPSSQENVGVTPSAATDDKETVHVIDSKASEFEQCQKSHGSCER